MQIRRLDPSDASAYRTLRLRALREFPQAFTSSYEEDEKVPLQASEQRIASRHNKFWGAFDRNNWGQIPISPARQRASEPTHRVGTKLESDPNYFRGELCGMVGLERETRAKNRHKATVVGMYVAQEQAGRGIGAALMQALIEDARLWGLELLVLTVTQDEENWGQIPISSARRRASGPQDEGSARRLYERCGFRSFGIEPHAIKVDGRAYPKNHMYLELTPS